MRSQKGAETNWCFMKFGSLFWPCGNHQSSTFGCCVLLLCLSVVAGERQKGDPQKKLLQLYIPCCTSLPSSLLVCELLEAVAELELGELCRFPRVGRCCWCVPGVPRDWLSQSCSPVSWTAEPAEPCAWARPGSVPRAQAWAAVLWCSSLWGALITWPESQAAVVCTCHSSSKDTQIVSLSAAVIAQSGEWECFWVDKDKTAERCECYTEGHWNYVLLYTWTRGSKHHLSEFL